MDMGPCHPLGAIDTACGSASPAWGCWGHGWALLPHPSAQAVLVLYWGHGGGLGMELRRRRPTKNPIPKGSILQRDPVPSTGGTTAGSGMRFGGLQPWWAPRISAMRP